MNSNTAEEKIRMMIEPIDTLQAGIVYGKEDAWDRLQVRLDAKPVRKAIPWYRISAVAAALLLTITISYYFLTDDNTDLPHGACSSYSGALSDARYITLPQTPGSNTITPIQDSYPPISVHIAPAHPLPHHEEPQKTDNEPLPVVVEEDTPAPQLPPAAPKMKVVHINELGQRGESDEHYAWEEKNPFPHVQFRMKIIHINDLGRPLTQEEYMRNAEKAAVWRLPFGHKQRMDNTQDERTHLFRINLSQN